MHGPTTRPKFSVHPARAALVVIHRDVVIRRIVCGPHLLTLRGLAIEIEHLEIDASNHAESLASQARVRRVFHPVDQHRHEPRITGHTQPADQHAGVCLLFKKSPQEGHRLLGRRQLQEQADCLRAMLPFCMRYPMQHADRLMTFTEEDSRACSLKAAVGILILQRADAGIKQIAPPAFAGGTQALRPQSWIGVTEHIQQHRARIDAMGMAGRDTDHSPECTAGAEQFAGDVAQGRRTGPTEGRLHPGAAFGQSLRQGKHLVEARFVAACDRERRGGKNLAGAWPRQRNGAQVRTELAGHGQSIEMRRQPIVKAAQMMQPDMGCFDHSHANSAEYGALFHMLSDDVRHWPGDSYIHHGGAPGPRSFPAPPRGTVE